MTYKLLKWHGPYKLREAYKLPDTPGLYLITNSSSPFLVDVHRNYSVPPSPFTGLPAILYVGMTTKSLRSRLQTNNHDTLFEITSQTDLENIYLYAASSDDPARLEEKMLDELKPLLNKTLSRNKPSIHFEDQAVAELHELLNAREEKESLYQELFKKHPWLLGLQYSSVQSHQSLDDENIPDFSGTRSRDSRLDIVEIKQPFMPVERASGGLSSQFSDAWNQAERYLDFTRTESDYLRRRKNLNFENAVCYLIVGGGWSDATERLIEAKQRLNPAIIVVTYDQIKSMAHLSKTLIRDLFGKI
ncbi:Shedu anti-phage system protein SduA domain-containing protein [Pseudomonas sp. S2_E02]|jgi:hypothetical protein